MRRLVLAIAAALVCCSKAAPPPEPSEWIDGGRLGRLAFFRPEDAPAAFVFLFSDTGGWGPAWNTAAASLRDDDGVAVVGVDLIQYQRRLRASDDGCHYLISEIEALSQQLQRELGSTSYKTPILAGVGQGATLAYAALAQSPSATVAGAVSVDPTPVLDTRVPLCPGAPSKPAAGAGYSYGPADDLPGWWLVSARSPLPPPLEGLVDSVDQPPPLDQPPIDRLVALIRAQLENADAASPSLRGLPITEIPVDKPGPWMAIIYSGDGGWRDLDKQIGESLAERGIPVVGVDSLRYFWSKKTPEQVAKDLDEMIDAYGDKWGTHKVAVIGYSFGAAIAPFAVNRLPAATHDRVVLVSLLGLDGHAPFQIEVEGWLGAEPDKEAPEVMPEMMRLDHHRVQCFYGEDEDDSLCPDPKLADTEVIRTKGGHHFDGDYAALAKRIYDGMQRRLGAKPAG